jgi:hypothetical protein
MMDRKDLGGICRDILEELFQHSPKRTEENDEKHKCPVVVYALWRLTFKQRIEQI